MAKSKTTLIGRKAFIKENNPTWAGFWGFVKHFDGRFYHVSGGAIGDNATPVFTRDELYIPRIKKQKKK